MNIGAVLLAAGASHRFGTENKLLANIGGKPLIRWVAEEITHSGAAEVVVVTGCDHLLIENALEFAASVRSQPELDGRRRFLDCRRHTGAWLAASGRLHHTGRHALLDVRPAERLGDQKRAQAVSRAQSLGLLGTS